MTRLSTTGPNAEAPNMMGGARRSPGGSRSRFVGTSHHGNRDHASLPPGHPALIEGRTLFPSRVKQMADVPRVLVDGHNNAKIGRWIEKGPWAPLPVLTLTLEERKTCPRTCEVWDACYGNAMPMPRRHAHGPELIAALDEELRYYAAQDADGFAVRLHILGDFYSIEYVAAWARWMQEIPQLHVWGYTARQPSTDIGDKIAALNDGWPDRWRVRFSVALDAPHDDLQVSTAWHDAAGDLPKLPAGSYYCPQQADKTATCGTCGLCFNTAADGRRVVFVGHGMRRRAS